MTYSAALMFPREMPRCAARLSFALCLGVDALCLKKNSTCATAHAGKPSKPRAGHAGTGIVRWDQHLLLAFVTRQLQH